MKIVKKINLMRPLILIGILVGSLFGCEEQLNAPFEDETFTSDVDYEDPDGIILPLMGAYEGFYTRGWEDPVTVGLRGDDVNAAGDQAPMQEQDEFIYLAGHWNANALWQGRYNDIVNAFTAIDEINKFRPVVADEELVDQYIAECRVIRAWLYLDIIRTFGGCIVIDDLTTIQSTPLSNKAEAMEYIADEMAEVIPLLPDIHPNKRTDIPGGITQYTAYAIQAIAYQEMEDYQGVADATSAIINSGEFQLYSDFYHLFKQAGKLSDENILEFQFSDFNSSTGDRFGHLYAPFGIAWNPVRTGAGGGWGFYEPTKKFIKFMLDRGETVRLETSVTWTPDGITEIENEWGALPGWIDNFNREGDEFVNNARKKWGAGKWIQPSTESLDGRNSPGSGKNMTVIRYAEILLMYAEALTRGANGSATLDADDAVNLVRDRAGLGDLSGVTTAQVLEEKFAELGTEWGIRFNDMVRTGNTAELSHEGRTFDMTKAYLPFPADQVSELPQLADGL